MLQARLLTIENMQTLNAANTHALIITNVFEQLAYKYVVFRWQVLQHIRAYRDIDDPTPMPYHLLNDVATEFHTTLESAKNHNESTNRCLDAVGRYYSNHFVDISEAWDEAGIRNPWQIIEDEMRNFDIVRADFLAGNYEVAIIGNMPG